MPKCPSCNADNPSNTGTCLQCDGLHLSHEDFCGMPILNRTSDGQVLDMQYIIDRKIIQNATGIKYLAEDAAENSHAVIHALPTALMANNENIKLFAAHANRIKSLSHQGIIALKDFKTGPSVQYFISEYTKAISLEQHLASDRPISPDYALDIFTPIARAIDYAHNKGFIHGDISPENIIITDGKHGKLADFGISRIIKDTIENTPGQSADWSQKFGAPEQFNKGNATDQSDIYSLAACIYDCLATKPPHWRGWMEYQIIKQLPAKLDVLNEKQNALLQKALSRNPKERPVNATELLNCLTDTPIDFNEPQTETVIPETPPQQSHDDSSIIDDIKAEFQEKLNASTAAKRNVESKLKAEIDARLETDAMLKAEADLRLETDTKLKAESDARLQAETKLRESTDWLEKIKAQASENLQAEQTTRQNAEQQIEQLNKQIDQIVAESQQSTKAYAEEKSGIEEKLKTINKTIEQIKNESQEKIDIEIASRLTAEQTTAQHAETIEQIEIENAKRIIAVNQTKEQLQNQQKTHLETIEQIKFQNQEQLQEQTQARINAEKLAQQSALTTKKFKNEYENQIKQFQSDSQQAIQTLHEELDTSKTETENLTEKVSHITADSKQQTNARILAEKKALSGKNELDKLQANSEQTKNDLQDKLGKAETEIENYRKQLQEITTQTDKQAQTAYHQTDTEQTDADSREIIKNLQYELENATTEIQELYNKIDYIQQDAQNKLQAEYHARIKAEGRITKYNETVEQVVETNIEQKHIETPPVPEPAKPQAKPKTKHKIPITKIVSAILVIPIGYVAVWIYCFNGFETISNIFLSSSSTQTTTTPVNPTETDTSQVPDLKKSGIQATIESYEKQIENGNTQAMVSLGTIYFQGDKVQANPIRAIELFTAAASKGDSEGMFNLGIAHHAGKGVKKDDKLARDYFQKAANLGDTEAMFNLGLIYYHGFGTEIDFTTAINWFTQAAKGQHPSAMYNLGKMYKNGDSVRIDTNLAKQWYQKAAALGHEGAIEKLRSLQEKP